MRACNGRNSVFWERLLQHGVSQMLQTLLQPQSRMLCELSFAVVHMVRSMDSYNNILGDPLIFWTLRAEAD